MTAELLPHTSDPLVMDGGAATFEMRAWMEGVEQSLQSSVPYVSTVNSSTSDIGSGQSFIGPGEFNLQPDVMVSCQLTGSATLFFEFSNDGVNWSTFPVSGFSVASGIHEFHTAVKGPRQFRVRLVDVSGGLTGVRLYTYYGTFRQPNAPLNQTLGSDADATIVKSYPISIDKALGRLGGVQQSVKFGYLSGLGTSVQLGTPSSWVDLWSYGGQRTSPTSTFTPYMASTSSADQGINVTWTYLDAVGDEQTVTVATDGSDGQTPVSLGVTAQEVYTGEAASDIIGDIACATTNSFSSGSPSNQDEVLTVINPNDNRTLTLARRIPLNKVAIINNINIYLSRASGAAGAADIVLQRRLSGGVWVTLRAFEPTTSVPVRDDNSGIVLPALSDFRVRIRDVSDAGSVMSGSINFDLVDA